MSSKDFRSGVPIVQIWRPLQAGTALPTMQAVPATAALVTPGNLLLNDVDNQLTAGNYQVMLGLVGKDVKYGGLTITPCTDPFPTMALSLTAGQAIQVDVDLSDMPSGANNAMLMAVFIIAGSANPVLTQFAYIDPTTDFQTVVLTNPLPGAPSTTSGVLTAGTDDGGDIFGSFAPIQGLYTSVGPTTDGVLVDRQFVQVTFRPDNGPDFAVPTVKSATVSFDSLPNGIKDIIQAAGGNYATIVDEFSKTIQLAQSSLAFVSAKLTGNNAIQLIMPVNKQGFIEHRIYIGNLTTNSEGFQETWTKTNQVPVKFKLVPAIQDGILTSMHTEIQYMRQA